MNKLNQWGETLIHWKLQNLAKIKEVTNKWKDIFVHVLVDNAAKNVQLSQSNPLI